MLAASDKIVYDRWQIQCKNMKMSVGVEVIAKEFGLTILTKADVIMVVTTSRFASDAINYANQVNDQTRYYVVLLDGEDVANIAKDNTRIVDILNLKARRVFAKKELGMSDLGGDIEDMIKEEKEPVTEEELEEAIKKASNQTSLEGFNQ